MERLEMALKTIGYIVLIVLCILSGIYAGYLNPSRTFGFFGTTSSVVGFVVGIGVALVETAIILLFMGKNAQENLENAEIPDKSHLHHVRNWLMVVSRHKAGLVAMLVVGLLPPAWWIARPLYVLSAFKPHLPEYLALATSIAPRDSFPVEGTPGSDKEEDEDSAEAPVQPDFGGNAAAEVARETRVRNEEIAKHRVPKPSHLPVKGRIMPVNVNEKIIDPVFFSLSSEMRPSRPDEVGAVAALWWWEETVGQYGSGDGDTNAALQNIAS